MKLQDMDKVDAWKGGGSMALEWNEVTVESVTEGVTSNDNPQLEIDYANNGGATIREWIVVIPKTRGKLKTVLEAAGLDIQPGDWDFDSSSLVGRKLGIYVGEEPKYDDPTTMVRRVQAHRATRNTDIPDTGNNNAPAVDDEGAAVLMDDDEASPVNDTVTIYRAKDGWRWRRRAVGNNEIVGESGEAYNNLRDAESSAGRQRCRVVVDDTPVE